MKPSLRFSVPLWTLLVFSAFLKSALAQCNSTCQPGTLTVTTTTTTANVSFDLHPSCNLTVNSTTYGNGLITGLTPGAVYLTAINCPACCSKSQITTKPEMVTNLRVSDSTTSSLFVTWNKTVGNSSFYKVQWTNGTVKMNDTVIQTYMNITYLTAGFRYEISVTAVADDSQTEGGNTTVIAYTKPGTIERLTVTTSTSSISMNWTAPPGQVFMYKVVWNSNGTTNATFTNGAPVILSYLIPGTTYSITVTAIAGDNKTEGVPYNFISSTMPQKPGNINVTQDTSSLTISWILPGGRVDNYVVNISNGNLMFNTSSKTQATTAYFTNLQPGRLYNITVTAVAGYFSNTSDQVSFATVPTPPGTIIFSNWTSSSLQLDWTTPAGMNGAPNIIYYITYQAVSGALQSNTSTQTNTVLSLLESGTNYSTAVQTVGPGNLSSTAVYNSSFTLPKAVTNLTVGDVNTTSIKLTWSRQTDYKPSYSYLVIASQDGTVVKNDTTKNETYTFYDLIPGKLYTFFVFTVVEGFKSVQQNTQSCTQPEAVSNITVIGNTTSLSVSWNQVRGWVSTYSAVLYRDAQVLNSTDVNNATTNTVFVGLKPGVLYCVELITKSGPLKSNSSPVCNATLPNPPGPITVVSQTVSSINFTWSLPQDMDYNEYNFSVSDGSSFVKEHNWFLVENLKSGSPYNISVITVGLMGYKSTAVTTVNYTRPYPVTNLTQTEITTNAVTLVWEQPESKLSYSYEVQVTNMSSAILKDVNVRVTNQAITDLRSGSNFSFTVTTLTADGTQAAPVTVSYFTRPYAISELKAQTLNTTAIQLVWMKPLEYRNDYKYWVETTGCSSKNNTVENETIVISELSPGTSCTFCVSVMAANGIKGGKNCTSQYTKPETVQPSISSQSNSSITVTWTTPKGNVEHYNVSLNGSVVFLNSSCTSYQFQGLSAGRTYIVIVTTISGPFSAQSGSSTTATIPNPPELIQILYKTTSSIEIRWNEAPLMTGANFFYQLTYTPSLGGNVSNISTINTSYILSSLSSGTSYNISVATVGELGFGSEWIHSDMVTTRPLSVQNLRSTTEETSIMVSWDNPADYKEGYKYTLSWTPSDQSIPVSVTGYNISNLVPGSCYNITVTTATSDKTQGAPKWISSCTNASPVTSLYCQCSNKMNPEISLSCSAPRGQYTFLQIFLNGNIIPNVTSCNYTISNLQYSATKYNVTVKTLSFGQPSIPVSCECSVDITTPTTIAIGATLGVFLFLFIVLIGFIIYWKRRAKEESPDIQIQSLSPKVSVAVNAEDFEAYFKKQKADSNCGFAEEFEDLKVVGTAQSKLHALNMENKPKNRYNNVLPYDSSRVKLSIIHGNPYDDYINANYMPGYNSRKEFIAAQGPLPTTVNDFWRMIWEKNVQTLVMLTRCNEQGRVKCEQYWNSGAMKCGNIIVTATSEISLEDWTIRDFDVKNVKTAETRAVRQFHFTAWPDHGVPETTELLISFRHLVRENMDQYSQHSPAVVHCSAGVGRTGTFIAIDRLIFQIERENTVDVYGIVHDLRMHRPLMVQTEDQYVFLNQCALDIIRSRTGTNVDLIYQNTAALSIYENIEPKRGFPKNGYRNA